jgi:hypothetical protein
MELSASANATAMTTGSSYDAATSKSNSSVKTTSNRGGMILHAASGSLTCKVCMSLSEAGVPEKRYGLPSVRPIITQPWGQQMSTLLDPDGNLLRMIADDGSD